MRIDWDGITRTIRETVSALEAGKALGMDIDRNGRCACPIHGGVNKNCKLNRGVRGFHCFKCGAGGDVIDLVRAVNGYGFKQAVEWLNSAFHLALPIDRPISESEAESARTRRERARRARETRECIRRMQTDAYFDAVCLEAALLEDAKRYRPADPDAEWDERFCLALQRLPDVRAITDELEDMVIKREDRE